MDRRGYTIDPNRSPLLAPEWWQTLGDAQRPSPYATASWVYINDYTRVVDQVLAGTTSQRARAIGIPDVSVWDNGDDFTKHLYSTVWDNGLIPVSTLDGPQYDGGVYVGTDGRRSIGNDALQLETVHILARVSVYDSLASDPGPYSDIEEDLGILQTDGGDDLPRTITDEASEILLASEVVAEFEADLAADLADDPDVLSNPDGDILLVEEKQFDVFELETEGNGAVDDLAADGTPDGGELFDIKSSSGINADKDPGTPLGFIEYQLYETTVVILDWAHYNWHDDTPVRKAWRHLYASLPDCVTQIIVEAHAPEFWVSLGFNYPEKGSTALVYYPL